MIRSVDIPISILSYAVERLRVATVGELQRLAYDHGVENVDDVLATSVAALRGSGARFAFLFGSRAQGTSHEQSDVDVAAWWPGRAPLPWTLDLPDGVDLVDVGTAPLELLGRIACEGQLLFDDDPPARVEWQATTRKIWLDERDRFARSHRQFLEAAANG